MWIFFAAHILQGKKTYVAVKKKHMWLIFLKFILQRGSGWKLFPVVICTVAQQLNSPAPPPLDINAQQKFGTKDGGGNKSQMDTVGVRIGVWEFCQTPSWNQWKKKRETSLSSEFPFSQKSRTCIFLIFFHIWILRKSKTRNWKQIIWSFLHLQDH